MAMDRETCRRRQRARRHARIHKRIRGTARRPRLVVSRSLRHMEGQLVDDDRGETICGFSTRSSAVEEALEEEGERGKRAASFAAGKLLARRAREAGVEKAVFDRAGHPYQGRVEAFADGAREGGLEF